MKQSLWQPGWIGMAVVLGGMMSLCNVLAGVGIVTIPCGAVIGLFLLRRFPLHIESILCNASAKAAESESRPLVPNEHSGLEWTLLKVVGISTSSFLIGVVFGALIAVLKS
jgi:hypothetical protein